MPNELATVVDGDSRRYLVLRVAIAHDHTEGAPAQTRWCADVADAASPLAGLYAFAESLAIVREAIATLAWSAIKAGELLPYGVDERDLSGIHVVTTECAVYEAAWLSHAVANDAA